MTTTQQQAAAEYQRLQADHAAPTVDATLADLDYKSRALTSERVGLAERRVRYEGQQRSMAAVFWAFWLALLLVSVILGRGALELWKAQHLPWQLVLAGLCGLGLLWCVWAPVQLWRVSR